MVYTNLYPRLESERCVNEKDGGTNKYYGPKKNKFFVKQCQNYLCLKSTLTDGTSLPPLGAGVSDNGAN
jgi:hypothetical protein